jgi:hypothetical protein
MHNLDLLPQTADEFVHRAAVLLPNIAVALGIIILGWLIAKVARFAVERALRAVNFNVLTERAGTDHFLSRAVCRATPPRCSVSSLIGSYSWRRFCKRPPRWSSSTSPTS